MRRLLLGLPGLLLMLAVQLLNAAALLLDELFFRRYRKVALHRPVFILGVPRSGTTYTHHLLSSDTRFTTVRLWEALFAPSITQRQVLTRLARLDACLGGYMGRLLSSVEQRLQSSMDGIHPTGLHCPEEDFLLLMSSLDCFLLVLAFPDSHWLWNLAQGDRESDRNQTDMVMKRYRRLLQRHACFHGAQLQILSKNASFAGLAKGLADEFPDSVFIICERDAPLAVRSQLRSLSTARQQLSTDRVCPVFESRLLETLHFYYRNLDSLKELLPAERCASVALFELSRQPRQSMQKLLQQLSLASSSALDETLSTLESSDPVRPGTTESGQRQHGVEQALLERFQAWRHAPEKRL